MKQRKLIHPGKPNQALYWLAGVLVLVLNRLRYAIKGYQNPRPIAASEIEKHLDYDRQTVHHLTSAYSHYTGKASVKGKSILELGPGPDLGAGLLWLDQGVSEYTAIDANPLVKDTKTEFYKRLLSKTAYPLSLQTSLDKVFTDEPERLRYICEPSFDLSQVWTESIDIIFSQAAFEHFTDIEKTIDQMSQKVQSGAVFIAEIDFMTHSRGLREKDPLNIYRYSPALYSLGKFKGQPNRRRPNDYVQALQRAGWTNIQVIPIEVLDTAYVHAIRKQLDPTFRSPQAEMHTLTAYIMATKI